MASIILQFATERGLASALIRYYSHGAYSHVDAVLPDGRLLGARLNGGVQIREPGYVKFTRIERVALPCSEEIADGFYTWWRGEIGKPYDLAGILAFAADRDWRTPDSWFCSEGCGRGLEISRYFTVPLSTPSGKLTPDDLRLAVSARPVAMA